MLHHHLLVIGPKIGHIDVVGRRPASIVLHNGHNHTRTPSKRFNNCDNCHEPTDSCESHCRVPNNPEPKETVDLSELEPETLTKSLTEIDPPFSRPKEFPTLAPFKEVDDLITAAKIYHNNETVSVFAKKGDATGHVEATHVEKATGMADPAVV